MLGGVHCCPSSCWTKFDNHALMSYIHSTSNGWCSAKSGGLDSYEAWSYDFRVVHRELENVTWHLKDKQSCSHVRLHSQWDQLFVIRWKNELFHELIHLHDKEIVIDRLEKRLPLPRVPLAFQFSREFLRLLVGSSRVNRCRYIKNNDDDRSGVFALSLKIVPFV